MIVGRQRDPMCRQICKTSIRPEFVLFFMLPCHGCFPNGSSVRRPNPEWLRGVTGTFSRCWQAPGSSLLGQVPPLRQEEQTLHTPYDDDLDLLFEIYATWFHKHFFQKMSNEFRRFDKLQLQVETTVQLTTERATVFVYQCQSASIQLYFIRHVASNLIFQIILEAKPKH